MKPIDSVLVIAEWMKKFYRGLLQQRLRPAAALRAAQIEMSRDPRWQALLLNRLRPAG